MVPNSFLVILFSIIIILPFTISQNKSLDEYYNGGNGDQNDVNGEDLEDNDCLCDINPLECDFQCCCDENCPNEAIENWENHSKCINEQNTPRLSDDKCVDINLFPTWYYNSSKEYPRRGIHLEKQTEDVPKKSAVITNLCFSIDNSKSKDIKTLDDLEKYGYKSIDKLYDDIFDLYIEPYFINNNKKSNTEETATENENNKKSIEILATKNKYFVQDKLTLLSGTNCENVNIVEIFSPKNYSCLKKRGEITSDHFNNVKITKNKIDCYLKKYYVSNGLLSLTGEGNNVLQAEFILNINPVNSDIDHCEINLVLCQDNEIGENYVFKNLFSRKCL